MLILYKYRTIRIVVFAILLFAGVHLPAQNPYIQHFTTQDGLPSNSVYTIIQDRNNFIWVGTDAGVARYDGNEFTGFSKKDGLNSNEIVRIKEDSQGRIWFFNLGGSMNYFYQNKIYNSQNAPFLDSLQSRNFFRDFYEDTDLSLYFYSFWSREIVALNAQNQVKRYPIPVIPYDWEGIKRVDLLIHNITKTPEDGFVLWASAGVIAFHDFSDQPRHLCDTIHFGSCYELCENKFLLQGYEQKLPGKSRSLFFHSNGKFSAPIDPPFHYETFFVDAIETDNGVLWIATIDKGVFCIRNNIIINHINIAEAQTMVQDHEGNVWISSMSQGAYKVSPYFNALTHYGNEVFDNAGISAMCLYPQTGVWMTNGDRVYLLKNQKFYTLDFSMNQRKLNQLYWLVNNSLIVGTKNYDFFLLPDVQQIESGRKIDYSYPPKIITSFNGPKAIAISPAGNEMYAYAQSNLWAIDGESFFREVVNEKFGERIHNIFFDLNDELVVNAKKNYLFREGKLIPYEKLSSINNRIITGHLRINDSIEVINVEGDSNFLMCGQQLCNLTQAMNRPISMMVKKMAYHEPVLYLATAQNIFVIEHPEHVATNQSIDNWYIDINFRQINELLVFNDSLYVASDDGLTIIPESGISRMELHVPIPYLQSVQVNGTDVSLADQEIRISGKSRIRFSFACINYSAAPAIYSYQLAGFDTSWNMGTAREVVYQNLDIGRYNFRVRAQKPGTEFSKPVELKIVVFATLLQQPLFYLGIFIILAGLALWSLHRRMLRRRRLLEMDSQLIVLEQKALQAMMNPHFIFNALGSIQNYILQSKPDEAGLYLSQFARLIRQNLNAINASMINLEEEIDRLKNYLDLERLRMDYKFAYHIEFEEGFDEEDLLIPSMIIQPFVENAVWHGIAPIADKGTIRIIFGSQAGNHIKITIEDNGVGIKTTGSQFSKSEQHLHLGIEMTRKRLEILGKKQGIKTSIQYSEIDAGSPNPGTRVVLIVPVSYD